MLKKTPLKLLLVIGFLATLIGCSSVEMANIPSTADPKDEIAKLDTDINQAVTKNIDVLARDEFKKSQSYLNQAKSEVQDSDSQSDILDSLRTSRGYLNKAYTTAGKRENKASGLFAARQMALTAGAGSFPEIKDDFSELDQDVSQIADELNQTKAETLSELQNQYVDLERRAVIYSKLSKTQAVVNGAENDGAKNKASTTFKKAELSLKTAESMISTNVRNPSGYSKAVTEARKDALLLKNVMMTIKENGNNLAENVALKLVKQKKTISGLETDLSDESAKSFASLNAMERKNDRLSSANDAKDAKLATSNQQVRVQKAIENARTQFSKNEAEAYQQGENLVIRLKQITFATGKSDLPGHSLPLLAKVLEVAKSLNPSQITVEGHTDSIGQEATNKTISESRASAVSRYFKTNGLNNVTIESQGYGFKNPIASNKTKEGRAQNRRVDIVITPAPTNN